MPDLDEVMARIEKVERLPRTACARLIARTTHVAYSIEAVAVLDCVFYNSPEYRIKFLPRHRERKMPSAFVSQGAI